MAVLDVMLPGIDGFEVARQLRAATSTRNIALIFLTAISAKFAAPESKRMEAIYVPKPFDPIAFSALVRQAAVRPAHT